MWRLPFVWHGRPDESLEKIQYIMTEMKIR
jgi:hypothetical protein